PFPECTLWLNGNRCHGGSMDQLLIIARWFAWIVIAGLILRRFSATRRPTAAAVGGTAAVIVGAIITERAWIADIEGASFPTFALCGVAALLFFEWRERRGFDEVLSPKAQRSVLVAAGALVVCVLLVLLAIAVSQMVEQYKRAQATA